MQPFRRHLTFANLLAAIAIFVVLGGVAYAGSKIGTSQIRNGAVTSKKLADQAVTGKKLNKARLGSVPKAKVAQKVNGMRIQRFSAKPAPGTPLTTLETVGTLKLEVGCSGGGLGHPLFTVLPANGAPPQGTRLSVMLNGNAGETANNTIGKGQGTLPSSGITVLDGTENSVGADGTVEAATGNGKVTTIQWAARGTSGIPSANPDEADCFFYGTAISG
jgi:hypothetical protein